MKLFAQLVENGKSEPTPLTAGLITHRLRPVYYSPSSRTALAEAELKYKNIKSRSVYVSFPLDSDFHGVSDVQLAIWTTTPWTLPANMVSLPWHC
jgi:isoleucyl-tRNA synthetase